MVRAGRCTLFSTRENPWKEDDFIYEDGSWVMYCNKDVPYFGLVSRLPDFS